MTGNLDAPVTIGLRAPHGALTERDRLAEFVGLVESLGLDRICIGDHVSFQGGQGFDGLVQATAIAVLARKVVVQTAVYLLPLRHPVPVARQLSSLAELAPGRISFGVGVGGEDRSEVLACGVDPSTRGQRMDESLSILRPLLRGEAVTHDGAFFTGLRDTRILPTPASPIPVVVGGRTGAALRRTALHGDGWLALWVSPRRFTEATAQVEAMAADAGRHDVSWRHGLQVWCGLDEDVPRGRDRLATAMESLYRQPFSNFERYCPVGPPEVVAEALLPYVAAGARDINLIPIARDDETAAHLGAEVRALLRR